MLLAIGHGPVPEIVKQGVGGIYVDSLEAVVTEVKQVANLDRRAVRRWAVERFDVSQMVDGYLRIFDRVAQLPEDPR
jgi:hypothetical protein